MMKNSDDSLSTTKYRNNAPKISPPIVINKFTNVHLVEQTKSFLFPILSVENIKMENMGIIT